MNKSAKLRGVQIDVEKEVVKKTKEEIIKIKAEADKVQLELSELKATSEVYNTPAGKVLKWLERLTSGVWPSMAAYIFGRGVGYRPVPRGRRTVKNKGVEVKYE
jgi:hypothetical protein